MDAYLDYNATSPLDPAVLEEMRPFLTERFANASSFHRKGQLCRAAIETARSQIADCMSVEPGDIYFTSGGTEADNWAILGTAEKASLERSSRKRIVVSSIEHPAVLASADRLKRKGFEVILAPVSPGGLIELEPLERLLDDRTLLLCVMHVNNEVGTVQPIEELGKMAKRCGVLFHCDAVQSFGKLQVHPEKTQMDLCSVSAHKICGPKGAGALYIRKGTALEPIFFGGHQEKGQRPGTENVAAIVGFGKAAELAVSLEQAEKQRVSGLRQKLREALSRSVPGIRFNGDPRRQMPHVLHASFEGLDGEALLIHLDLEHIYVSAGSACASGSVEPSHVLLAMGLPKDLARASVRFSIGRFTTQEEVDLAIRRIPPLVKQLRRSSVKQKGIRRIK